VPFFSEFLYGELRGKADPAANASVHMEDYPAADLSCIDEELERRMSAAQKIVSLARAARTRVNLKIRQPLSELRVVLPKDVTPESLKDLVSVIAEELNVKKVVFSSDPGEVTSLTARPNFKLLGPKLGKSIGSAKQKIESLPDEELRSFKASGSIELDLDGRSVALTSDEIEVVSVDREGFAAESDSGYTVAVSTRLSDKLINEGLAREMVNKIQNMRKTSGLEVTDRINVLVQSDAKEIARALQDFRTYIMSETLADSLEFADASDYEGQDWKINEFDTRIGVSRTR
jgi:isoleucyl-tRNA synthetase